MWLEIYDMVHRNTQLCDVKHQRTGYERNAGNHGMIMI